MPQPPLASEPAPPQPVGLIGAESDISTTKQQAADSQAAAVPATASWAGRRPDCPVDVASGSDDTAGDERYDLLHHLGSGGFGTVHLAWDRLLHREVAIKRPKTKLDPDFEQVFIHEARAAAGLRHPGIVTVHDAGVDHRGLFIIYEHVTGGSLKSRLHGEPWPLNEALELTLAIVEALAEAHRKGLTHRDLKPANILLNAAGRPQIADFGLALAHDDQAAHEGEIAGTEKYMAPEQIRGDAHLVDGRTDLWAVGVILYELLTGHLPFAGRSSGELRSQILSAAPRPPRQWVASLPCEVEQLVLRLLAKGQNARPSSAGELADELRRLLISPKSSEAVAKSEPTSAPFLQSSSGIGMIAVAVVSIVAMLSVVGGLYLTGIDRRPSPPESQYPVGTWTPLLEVMPPSIQLEDNAATDFAPGRLKVTTIYPAMFKVGTTEAADYSIRLTLQPEFWNGDAGLIIGLGASDQPSNDKALLVGVMRRSSGKATILARTMQMQREGVQLPRMFRQAPFSTTEVEVKESARIQVDIQKSRVARVFLNDALIPLPPSPLLRDFPAAGDIGIFSMGGTTTFLNPAIRITRE